MISESELIGMLTKQLHLTELQMRKMQSVLVRLHLNYLMNHMCFMNVKMNWYSLRVTC